MPLAPDVLDELRESFRKLQPELDDHVFTVEVEQWISQYERKRERKDPKTPASDQALWRMVRRVCGRAGSVRCRHTSYATDSRTASCAKAAVTSPHCGH